MVIWSVSTTFTNKGWSVDTSVLCLDLHLHATIYTNHEELSLSFLQFYSYFIVQLPQASSSYSHKKSKKKKKHSSKIVRSHHLCTSHFCSVTKSCNINHEVLFFLQSNGYDDDLTTLSSRVSSGLNNRVMKGFVFTSSPKMTSRRLCCFI